MSLLIKALDNLDKNKQAEKSKKLETGKSADAVLSLELTPLESELKSDATAEISLALQEKTIEPLAIKAELAVGAEGFVRRGPSLADEAGLSAESSAVSRFAKSKQGVNKPVEKAASKSSAQPSKLTNHLQEALQANSAKNKIPATPTNASYATSLAQTESAQIGDTNQKVAAKVFVANNAVKTPTSKTALALLAVAGTLMIWLGLQGFAYIKTLAIPEVVVVKPSLPIQPQLAVNNSAEVTAMTSEVPLQNSPSQNSQAIEPTQTQIPAESVATNNNNMRDKNLSNQARPTDNDVVEKPNSDMLIASKPNSNVVAENEAFKKPNGKKLKNSNNEVNLDDETASANATKRTQKHAPLQLISKAPAAGVDPTLLSAYQAFNRGEDVSAQQQYRQVLQRDIGNVDALLGMAAIAQRQGRDADAVGWYQKVLEIEPRNTIAQSAILSPQVNTDVVGTESRIKNMLALQPDGANLHAALGNLYAAQNQWPAAQEAYFNASRFAPNNADYAFNLAISLDQLGKSNLALKQYQRALELLNKSGASSPDRAQLEARIRALQ